MSPPIGAARAGVTSTTGDAIPDSEGLHARYDWTQASGTSTVADQTGNGHDLTGSYSGPNESINGNQAGEFDGSDDVLDVEFSTINQPTTIAWVGRYDATIGSADAVAVDQVGTNNAHQFFADVGGNTSLFTTAGLTGPASTNDATVYVAIFDGSNSEVHVGNASDTGDAGTGALQDGLTVGADQSGGRNFTGAMQELLVYPTNQSSIVGEIKNYLANQADLTL